MPSIILLGHGSQDPRKRVQEHLGKEAAALLQLLDEDGELGNWCKHVLQLSLCVPWIYVFQ